jgi:two-component system chemotaxis response regulator CheB
MRKAGAKTFGQSEGSCIVYGMPKAAYEAGAVEKQLPLEKLAQAIISETSTNKRH